MEQNKADYQTLLKLYEKSGYWSVFNAMTEDGYDPNCDYTTMLGILVAANVVSKANPHLGGDDDRA